MPLPLVLFSDATVVMTLPPTGMLNIAPSPLAPPERVVPYRVEPLSVKLPKGFFPLSPLKLASVLSSCASLRPPSRADNMFRTHAAHAAPRGSSFGKNRAPLKLAMKLVIWFSFWSKGHQSALFTSYLRFRTTQPVGRQFVFLFMLPAAFLPAKPKHHAGTKAFPAVSSFAQIEKRPDRQARCPKVPASWAPARR